MIELKNVSGGYGEKTVLRDITIRFPRGVVTVLLGSNGCGKSTLLKTALGLMPAFSGTILYDGQEIRSMTPRAIAQKAAYLSQSRNIPNITAGRMVLHGRFPHLSYPRHYSRQDREIVRGALEKTGSLDLSDRQMNELSGGQRQKIYVSMALAQQAQTIFMDEPTTYLDVRHQLEMMRIAKELAQGGTAVVMVLHDLSLALRFGDQIAVLEQGQLAQIGTPEEVFESGVLDRVFDVRVCRVETEDGFHYYCQT